MNDRVAVRKWPLRFVLLAVVVGLLYRYPLFRIVRLHEAKQQRSEQEFDPARFAQQFWEEQLLGAVGNTVDAITLMKAVREDPRSAKDRHGQSLGIGSVYCYFLRGNGYVVAINADSVDLSLTGAGGEADVTIQTGLIFGNAIRDGSALIDVNQFPNSQDFNKISEAINAIVETRVLPPFKEQVNVGAKIEFAGCAEILDEALDLDPLRIVPIVLTIQ
jgi:predicted lipoprotein